MTIDCPGFRYRLGRGAKDHAVGSFFYKKSATIDEP